MDIRIPFAVEIKAHRMHFLCICNTAVEILPEDKNKDHQIDGYIWEGEPLQCPHCGVLFRVDKIHTDTLENNTGEMVISFESTSMCLSNTQARIRMLMDPES